MANYTEKAKTGMFPVIALRDVVAFPHILFHLEVSDPRDLRSIENALEHDSLVFLVALKNSDNENPMSAKDFATTGIVGKITARKNKQDKTTVTIEGIERATIMTYYPDSACAAVIAREITENTDTPKIKEAHKRILATIENIAQFVPKFSKELSEKLGEETDLSLFADAVAFYILVSPEHKQSILDCKSILRRLTLLDKLLDTEIAIMQEDFRIHSKVREALEQNQRDYYLREQLRIVKEELGMNEEDEEASEYLKQIAKKKLPQYVEERLIKEVGKLDKTPFASAEATVLRNYLDTVLEIPFGKFSKDKTDVTNAKAILDRDHYGLDKVKERILEFIAAKQMNPELNNQIICLVGPPGVGKTSIAASLAESLGRKYVRVSLGGVRDEADIRGHRKTYVASMPGRIVNALIQAETQNPLILLDEIDKMANDHRGDPASALLEVLDSEQNKSFRDHFVELPIDLSGCVFIATANTLETVAPPLIDRMEVIELTMYNRNEKLAIAKNHLIPKQLKRHGLKKSQLRIADDAVLSIVDRYTAEAGVRTLERTIARLCRKTARILVEGSAKSVKVTGANLKDFLGNEKFLPDRIYNEDPVGIVNGLAYTQAGGDLLRVEAIAMPGSGKIETTGNLGDVITESAKIAVSYIRKNAVKLGINPDFHKTNDLHIHFPDGATPKDGPSAGVTLVTALCSELSGIPARRDVAMTGEVTLHGKVLPIGGLREKTMAAYKAGITTVLIPNDNRKDMEDIDPEVKEKLQFIFCENASDVLQNALCYPEENKKLSSIPPINEQKSSKRVTI
ncbi:MAG: endopeptidase La [Ruminococcaceae bacterium]|nr:endopeptidase La [Oscillospiraceae bacterium]